MKQLAENSNIGYSTLQKWLRLKREGLPLTGQRRGRPTKGQGHKQPVEHLLATANLDETAIGAYCREHGIHSFQLAKWKENLMGNTATNKQSKQINDELKKLRQENKRLKHELGRKDKALAETSALLVLKKKANLIWGEPEDD